MNRLRTNICVTVAGVALLALGACAGPGSQNAVLAVTMTGIQEFPGPGDPDGTGTVTVRVMPHDGQVCWDLYARGIEAATAAHIHRGEAGIAGPVVLTLTTPDSGGHSQGCAAVDPGLALEMANMAHGFYVNVHNAAFPNGAIRGQMQGGPRSHPAGVSQPEG
jgi:hypothetical protein